MLARAPRAYPQWKPSQLTTKKATKSTSIIEGLPSEMLALILSDYGLSRNDIVSFGLASTTLWIHVLQHMRITAQPSGPLAGTPIACIGTYLVDLPEPFKKDDFLKKSVDYEMRGAVYTVEARKVNYACLRRYEELPQETDDGAWSSSFDEMFEKSGIHVQTRGALKEDIRYFSSTLRGLPADSNWVLRNLTTHEYVHIVPSSPSSTPVPNINSAGGLDFVDPSCATNLSLDDVLLMRFCWTRDFGPGYALPYGPHPKNMLDFLQGPWASHAFDVLPIEDFADDLANGADVWTDVTSDVVRQAEEATGTKSSRREALGRPTRNFSRCDWYSTPHLPSFTVQPGFSRVPLAPALHKARVWGRG